MSDERTTALLVGFALTICAFLGFLVYGWAAVVVVFGLAVLWLIWALAALTERLEEARADVDETLGGLDAVKDHLSGNEPDSYGQHAHPDPPSYRSPTWPAAS